MKAANLRSTRSVKGTNWNSVKAFAETEGFPIIIKPAESAGSYGVKLCHNACEAETHFRQLSWQLQGRRNREVLLQEYLKGSTVRGGSRVARWRSQDYYGLGLLL